MHKPGKRFAYMFSLLVLIAPIGFVPRLVSASGQTELPLPTPVPTEPSIYPGFTQRRSTWHPGLTACADDQNMEIFRGLG